MTQSASRPMRTMIDLIQSLRHAKQERGLTFYPSGNKEPVFYSYQEVYRRVVAAMEHYRRHGVSRGTRVVFPFDHSAEVLFSFFALIGVGALPVLVRPHLGGPADGYLEFLTKLVERYGIHTIVATPSLRALAIPLEPVPLATDAAPTCTPEFPHVAEADLVFVQFSSGSTSFPKGVPITHRQLLDALEMICRTDKRTEHDTVASWLPLYHDMGLVGGLLTNVYAGCSLHLSSPRQYLMDPVGWVDTMLRAQVIGWATPNFGIDYLVKRLRITDLAELSGWNFEGIRMIYVGSEPISVAKLCELAELLRPYGFRWSSLSPCYGMAEAVLMVSCVPQEEEPVIFTMPDGRQQISAGRPLPEFQLRIRDEDGRLCADGEPGEIEIKGGTIVDGYYDDDRVFLDEDGYFRSGDIGFLHGGDLFVTGRATDRFKVNAQSYFSSELEQAIETLSFVRTGRSAALLVEGRVVVVLEVRDKRALEQPDEHRQKVSDVLFARFGLKPADVLFLRAGQFEKTSSGKLRRAALVKSYLENRLQLACSSPAPRR